MIFWTVTLSTIQETIQYITIRPSVTRKVRVKTILDRHVGTRGAERPGIEGVDTFLRWWGRLRFEIFFDYGSKSPSTEGSPDSKGKSFSEVTGKRDFTDVRLKKDSITSSSQFSLRSQNSTVINLVSNRTKYKETSIRTLSYCELFREKEKTSKPYTFKDRVFNFIVGARVPTLSSKFCRVRSVCVYL